MTHMNHSKFSRFALVADLVICSLWLLLVFHVDSGFYYPLLWTIPVFRMWLSFLSFRRSRLALIPILFLGVFSLGILQNHGNPVFMLFNRPLLAIAKSAMAFFGSGSYDLAEFSDIWYGSWDYRYWIAGIASIWVILIPLAIYIYRCIRRQLIPSQLSIWKRIGLTVYLLAMLVTMSVFVGELRIDSVSVSVLYLLLMLIPVMFCKGKVDGILTRFEQSFLICLILSGVAYSCGVSYNTMSAITTVTLPVAFIALVNWNMGRKTDYKDVLLLVSGAALFYIAQYSIYMIRVILMIVSLGLFAVEIAKFAYSTSKYWLSIALYVTVALVMPVFCIGYNPFSV